MSKSKPTLYQQIKVSADHPVIHLRGAAAEITELMGHGVIVRLGKPIDGQQYYFSTFAHLEM